MCSMATGQCPSSTVSGYQFTNHYDCVNAGYGIAQQTFQNLKELEEFEREYIENQKIVVKFECRKISSKGA